MGDITISITTSQLAVALDLISILFFVISLFFLTWIKKKVSENLNKTFVYLMIASVAIIFVKILAVFANLNMTVPFVYDSFAVLFALFFLLAVANFHKSIAQQIRPRNHRVHHRVHHRSVRRKR